MSRIKSPILTAIAFFGTLGVLSVGYSAYVSNYPATATAGVTPLSAGEWNKMVVALQALDTNLSTFKVDDGRVGIGTLPAAMLHVSTWMSTSLWNPPNLLIENTSTDDIARYATATFKNGWGTIGSIFIAPDSNTGYSHTGGALGIASDPTKSKPITFITSNIARMVVNGNGHVWIGTTNPSWHLEVSASAPNGYVGITNSNNAAGWVRWTWLNGATGSPLGGGRMCFESGGACRFALDNSGNATAATFNGVSDSRLKTNVETVSGISAVSKLRGVEFDWKSWDGKSSGVIAQELEAVLPHLVATDSSPEKMRSVNYAGLSAYFIEAIKELKNAEEAKSEEIGVLREENSALRIELSKMGAKISEMEKKVN